ncbi:uncharacterized protein I206_107449 [Kwoniella pini CBS 10737]|uniref:Sulfhydryl oxidase n=1 Tax=Kwoniella pini CBS 10737 TaxID=1296096 RepID=A0A1B9HXC2_9TREE|nr:uncharacterized protein I206_05778 [Kwoniella pini CBS 10737]OCF47914.1 hypothetical protein I206_05778 [Kwoniella pini CBS 10737]
MLAHLGHLPRFVRLILITTFIIVIPTFYFLYPSPERLPALGEHQAGGIDSNHWRKPITPDYLVKEESREWDDELPLGESRIGLGELSDKTIHGGVIMPTLGNETAKAELGRSAWKVLHLMTLRYPDEPTEDDRQALKSYFYLFSRLYPCGECATEFQALLKEYPPQTGSRKSASLWLCHVHNLVNERLGKPEFDCLTLDETYDCGCGDESITTSLKPEATGEMAKNLEDERDIEEESVLGYEGDEAHEGVKARPGPAYVGNKDEEIDSTESTEPLQEQKGLSWHEEGEDIREKPLKQGGDIGPHDQAGPENRVTENNEEERNIGGTWLNDDSAV